MQPKIIEKDRFTVIGMDCLTTTEDNENHQVIIELWNQFKPRVGEVKNKKNPTKMVGIYKQRKNYPNRFSYIASSEVDNLSEIPKGMIPKIINPSKYAIFKHQGQLYTIDQTYDSIYNEWLPESDYEENKIGDNLEVFDLDFNEDDNPEVEIYIAVKNQE
ncbi:MAG: AraC family transcriptional regulator [Halanaerobiales bacterium]|nr:AraC family transcriptional regulator [Halanaerobiales bacterium]